MGEAAKWESVMVKVPKGYRSRNVNDRRGSRSSSGGGRSSGGNFGFPSSGGSSSGGSLGGLGGALGAGGAGAGRKKGGCGGMGLIILLVVLALLFFSCQGGGNTATDPGGGTASSSDSGTGEVNDQIDVASAGEASEDDVVSLVNFIIDDTQDEFWVDEYPRVFGQAYQFAQLDLFTGRTQTGGCGTASSNVGPFYCPADGTAYIDVEFMVGLQDQLGAQGDFAQAYIVAHEIAHHVQNLAGINAAVRQAQSGASQVDSNRLAVMLELQADCFAGSWAANAVAERDIIEAGDIEEGVNAAGAVGDDAITGSDNQENFTHGSSAQRIEWFTTGFDLGTEACDTFDGALG